MKIKVEKPKARRTWKINPRTRVKENERAYRRSRAKARARKLIAEESVT